MTLPQVGQIGGRGNDVCSAPAAPLAAPFGACCCCCCMTGLAGATTCCSLYKRTRSSKSIAGLLVSARNRCAIVVSSARTFGSFAVCASLRHFAASSRSSCSRSVTITLTGQTQIHTPGHDGEPCRGQKVPQPALKPAVRRSPWSQRKLGAASLSGRVTAGAAGRPNTFCRRHARLGGSIAREPQCPEPRGLFAYRALGGLVLGHGIPAITQPLFFLE
jgi:hypothetical protein